MKLRRLKILKFRNVVPGTELEFNDGYNVLLGQNGTGKTTLLRLISSVLRGDFVWLEKEAFALEAELEADVGKVLLSIDHRRSEPKENIDLLPSELRSFVPNDETLLTRMEIHFVANHGETWSFTQDENSAEIRVPGFPPQKSAKNLWSRLDYVVVVGLAVLRGMSLTWGDGNQRHDQIKPELLDTLLTILAGTFQSCRFDESLEVFSAITGRRSALGEAEYRSITGQITLNLAKNDRSGIDANLPIPSKLRNLDALKKPNFDSPADAVVLRHTDAPFLSKIAQMLGFVGAELKLDLLGKEVTEKEKTITYGNLRFFFHGRDGSIVNQDHLSYGQKRLLTFFYYLACNPHVVVADELVNGLHHAWIDECIREMGSRQVFVTSQNPVLLDHLGFDSAETVRRTFITCTAKPEGVRDRLTWANMSKKNADAFYRAYKVGAQHVGEILRTKGLW